ncbi:SDR family NAD(P)-dependent oxidoreductase [Sphingobium sp. EM0848]|uniref:SDR family NAD(P)-dependent oxidoreductase n=1 Tax=Sphingobium sp. EM0848 TaxID=2743473 RepID=UPI0021014A7B|nr:SDR family oxidoreductase [Sphingobium sp. EM0848]
MTFGFSDRLVLVTGGSSGIGAALAQAVSDAGAHVTITGTAPDGGAYDALPSHARYLPMNLLDRASVEAVADACPKLDILINNAGRTAIPEDFDAAIDAGLKGTHALTTALLPKLAESRHDGGGAVLSMASMTAFWGSTVLPGYGAAKAGLLILTRSLAQAWGARGVRVNALAPGAIRTPMTAAFADDPVYGPGTASRIALGRWGEAEDMVGPALFLCSGAARYVTGECLSASGGYMIADS